MSVVSIEAIAAAWASWHARHGGKLGPGPAFSEAIRAALDVEAPAIRAQARNAALEEAEKVADTFQCGSCGMDGKAGAAIRALKDGEG